MGLSQDLSISISYSLDPIDPGVKRKID